jgi:hemerythrin-like metal-binding protein
MLWVKSLETGVAKIDEQHKELFRQMDLLLDKANANRHKEVIEFLDKYIAKHFSDEQKMQADAKYPKAAIHKKYHDEYVAIFRKVKDKFLKEGPSISNNLEINKTVAGWLKDHIMVHDKEFAAYLKSRPA